MEGRKSEYCRSCDAARNRCNKFHRTQFGKWLLSQIDRVGAFEVLPKSTENLNALLELYNRMKALQPYQNGLLVKRYSFSLSHLSPAISEDGKSLGVLAAHNLVIAPQSVNAKLGNADYGYGFSLNISDLDPKLTFDRRSCNGSFKSLQNKLYRYFPELKKWVIEQDLPIKPDSKANKSSGYSCTRGDFRSAFSEELIRLMNLPEHLSNQELLSTLFSNLSYEDTSLMHTDVWGTSFEGYKQLLADDLVKNLLMKDSSVVRMRALTSEQVLYMNGPFSKKSYGKEAA